jgi:hypothetical protein
MPTDILLSKKKKYQFLHTSLIEIAGIGAVATSSDPQTNRAP